MRSKTALRLLVAIVGMAILPAPGTLAAAPAGDSAIPQGNIQQDSAIFAMVPAEARFVNVLHPAAMLQNPLVQRVIADSPEAAKMADDSIIERYGQPLSSCRLVVTGMLAPVKDDQLPFPQMFEIAVFDKPLDKQAILKAEGSVAEWEEIRFEGGVYWQEKRDDIGDGGQFQFGDGMTTCVAFPAENVFVKTTLPKIKTVLNSKGGNAWTNRLAAIPANAPVVYMFGHDQLVELKNSLNQAGFVPQGIAMHLPLVDKIELASIKLLPGNGQLFSLNLETASAEDAQAVSAATQQLLEMAQAMLPLVANQGNPGETEKEMIALATEALGMLKASTNDKTAVVALPEPEAAVMDRWMNQAKEGIATAIKESARVERMNKLRVIGLAVHNFHDANGYLPPEVNGRYEDDKGRPLLSWRVHLLPYMEEAALYKEFHLDEPWDSPHNKALLPRMPKDFALSSELPEGMSDVLAPVSKFSVLGSAERAKFAMILDGTSNTIMAIEASPKHAVPWTKPDDFVFDPQAADAMVRFGSPDDDAILVLMVDASTRTIKKSFSAELLQALFDMRDGKEVDIDR